MFKKAAAFVLATALALTMVACGQTADDANQTSVSNQTAVSEEQTSAEAQPAAPQSDPAEQMQTEPAAPESDTTEPAATEEMPAEQMTDETDPAGQTSTEQTTPETDPTEQPADEQETQGDQTDTQQSQTETTDPAGGKTLVAYFSWSGNTQEMASYIAEQTGGDLLELQPETPYPTDYNECGDVALAERDSDARPAIANLPETIEEYDSVLVGYPIWWHTAPMIIGTFLESYDLTGVDVYPFTQSASMDTEQFDNSIAFVRENANGATVHDGLFARPSDTGTIDSYLSGNGLAQ